MFRVAVKRSLLKPHQPLAASHLRYLSTLPNNHHIYIFDNPSSPSSHLLTLLPTTPPTPSLAIGTTTTIPPTPSSFKPNPHFLQILSAVLSRTAHLDPAVQSQAAALASPAGSLFRHPNQRFRDGSTGASDQGGAGGGGVGGYIHVSDTRKPPDFGRIAEPEDILGSLEVDGKGEFVDGTGRWSESGTYRVVTREGVLGLTEFVRGEVLGELRRLEQEEKGKR